LFKTSGASEEGFCAGSRAGAKSSANEKTETKIAECQKRFMCRDCNRFLPQVHGERYLSARDGIGAMEI
jgi:hypothetical protein